MQKGEPVSGPEVLLDLIPGAGALHARLEQSLRDQVRSGRLAPGARLPSSRALAAELGVSRGVVLEAYGQLVAEGYLVASQGAPTRVAGGAGSELAPLAARLPQPRYAYRFDPALPDLAAFPRDRWLRSLRAALRDAPYDALGHGDPRGAPELRNALMEYLGRARGAAPEPEHTLVCAGFTQGFGLLCTSLRERGIERIAIEDPGWARHRMIAEGRGLQPVPIPTDASGLDVAALAASGCETVAVTPAHQFPTGVVMSSERRAALLAWADEVEGLIVEDDYDSELRFDRGPLGALQGLAPERVCHIGSVSKRLIPSLRLGWILCPSWLTGELTFAKGLADGGTPVIEQLALAQFVARGELDRHLRRMRIRYRRRREVAVQALAAALPEASVTGVAAGLHVHAVLPAGRNEAAALRAAAQVGVSIEGAAAHTVSGELPAGLLIGYANLAEAAIERGIALLGEAVR
ncbi:MAG TPA: PLP-dependent aminotransferase family protein [Solirubrobacteraceae bacterium]|nr:PLP-dependent aminotransferase family protein [Solirubrobacteraceae bacterium]